MMKLRKNWFKLAMIFVGFVFLMGVSTAQAAMVLTSGDDLAYRIENLDVGGTLYNVDFLWETAENIYGSTPVFDFPSEPSARDAAGAVNDALNAYNAALGAGETLVSLVGPQDRAQESSYFRIGFTFELPTTIREISGNWVTVPFPAWDEGVGQGIVDSRAIDSWADFEVVPIPGAVWLFGSGLIGLIGIRRKMKS